MTEEENKAIGYLKIEYNLLNTESKMFKDLSYSKEKLKESILIALNLINKQQKEKEKKNKIIDLMSYAMTHEDIPQEEYCIWRDMSCELMGGNKECKNCIKQYFENKVEGE